MNTMKPQTNAPKRGRTHARPTKRWRGRKPGADAERHECRKKTGKSNKRDVGTAEGRRETGGATTKRRKPGRTGGVRGKKETRESAQSWEARIAAEGRRKGTSTQQGHREQSSGDKETKGRRRKKEGHGEEGGKQHRAGATKQKIRGEK
ncbi:hypothetical protein KR740_14670, partial [Staphylococcus aureus]|uniref:hypothetical protein n=1 Tax=Staphylococcus aureus TaxID=1280 RepID=UPI001C1F7F84